MNTISRIGLRLAAAALLVAVAASVQAQLGGKKGPTSKLFLSEVKGGGQIINDGKVYEPKQASSFSAPGTIIETKDDAHQAYVYSNGSALFVDANTHVEIARFDQEAFQPDRHAIEVEPSVSQSEVLVARGLVGICTSELISGTTMTYETPQAQVAIRGKRLVIATTPGETIVYLLEGDVTVRSLDKNVPSQVLRPGERAVVRPGVGGAAATIEIGPIDRAMMDLLDEKVAIACNAKKTVSFETVDTPETGLEITATPTVPQTPPTNVTVSPDRIEPKG